MRIIEVHGPVGDGARGRIRQNGGGTETPFQRGSAAVAELGEVLNQARPRDLPAQLSAGVRRRMDVHVKVLPPESVQKIAEAVGLVETAVPRRGLIEESGCRVETEDHRPVFAPRISPGVHCGPDRSRGDLSVVRRPGRQVEHDGTVPAGGGLMDMNAGRVGDGVTAGDREGGVQRIEGGHTVSDVVAVDLCGFLLRLQGKENGGIRPGPNLPANLSGGVGVRMNVDVQVSGQEVGPVRGTQLKGPSEGRNRRFEGEDYGAVDSRGGPMDVRRRRSLNRVGADDFEQVLIQIGETLAACVAVHDVGLLFRTQRDVEDLPRDQSRRPPKNRHQPNTEISFHDLTCLQEKHPSLPQLKTPQVITLFGFTRVRSTSMGTNARWEPDTILKGAPRATDADVARRMREMRRTFGRSDPSNHPVYERSATRVGTILQQSAENILMES